MRAVQIAARLRHVLNYVRDAGVVGIQLPAFTALIESQATVVPDYVSIQAAKSELLLQVGLLRKKRRLEIDRGAYWGCAEGRISAYFAHFWT